MSSRIHSKPFEQICDPPNQEEHVRARTKLATEKYKGTLSLQKFLQNSVETQAIVAEALGLSAGTFSEIVTGIRVPIDPTLLNKIYDYTKISPDHFSQVIEPSSISQKNRKQKQLRKHRDSLGIQKLKCHIKTKHKTLKQFVLSTKGRFTYSECGLVLTGKQAPSESFCARINKHTGIAPESFQQFCDAPIEQKFKTRFGALTIQAKYEVVATQELQKFFLDNKTTAQATIANAIGICPGRFKEVVHGVRILTDPDCRDKLSKLTGIASESFVQKLEPTPQTNLNATPSSQLPDALEGWIPETFEQLYATAESKTENINSVLMDDTYRFDEKSNYLPINSPWIIKV